MAGRPKIFEEEAVIEKATEVFWERGYEAASADELLAAMGIGKGSFYLAFKGGKKELYIRSLQQFSKKFNSQFLTGLAQSNNEIEYLKASFLKLSDEEESNKRKCCYIGNALVQTPIDDTDTKNVAIQLLASMKPIYAGIIRKAQQDDLIKTREDPEVLGSFLLNLWNGINVTRKMHVPADLLQETIQVNLQLIS